MKTCIRLFQIVTIIASVSLSTSKAALAATVTITFDNLPTLGPTNQSQAFADANGGSNTYQGVTFTSNQFGVTGNDYRVGGPAPNPAFGLTHSGNYFLNNSGASNDNVILTTSKVLTEAWFGRNEYYGFGGGASSLTVTAFGVNGDLGSATTPLPDTFPYTGNLPSPNNSIGNGLPDPLVRLDTSSFLNLVGITGYRISRVEIGSFTGNWIGDDFTFVDPGSLVTNVPEPGMGLSLLSLGFMGLVSFWGTRKTR